MSQLVLRRWQEISGGMEYRCFIRGGNIIGIGRAIMNLLRC